MMKNRVLQHKKRIVHQSFTRGMARLADSGGTLNRYQRAYFSPTSDRDAMRSDWEAVGGDLKAAIRGYRETLHK